MIKRILALILALLCFLCTLSLCVGAEPQPADPKIAAAHAAIASSVGNDTAGGAVVLWQAEALSMIEGVGFADIKGRLPVTPETAFELGDLSALFVALSVNKLVGEGKLDWGADIATYLPARVVEKLSLKHTVTLKHLLCGTAGFEGRTFDLAFAKDSHRFDSLEDAILAEVPRQVNVPDTFSTRSPFSVALAAYVVECVAETSYDLYATREILRPLGMESTVLCPTAESAWASTALGHSPAGEGQFAVAKDGGRTYAGLYPATGAVSTAADMRLLVEHLFQNKEIFEETLFSHKGESGIFTVAVPGLGARGGVYGVTTSTRYFGCSLWIDLKSGDAALVLTNTADSELLSLAAKHCDAVAGVSVTAGGTMPELESFEGVFVDAATEGESFVGKLARKSNNQKAEINGELLHFLGLDLRQIAPGIFADAAGDPELAVVQFLFDEEGEVYAVVTATGESYRPAKFYEKELPATVLFAALLVLSVFFICNGVLALLHWLSHHREEGGLRFLLPSLCSSLIAICVLLQVFVGLQLGASAFSSFFGALSVLTLIFSIGSTVGYLVAFITTVFARRRHSRVAQTAILFVGYLFLVVFYGLTVL